MTISKSTIRLASGPTARVLVAEFDRFSVCPFFAEPAAASVARLSAGLAQARLGAQAFFVPAPDLRTRQTAAWGDGRTLEIVSMRVANIMKALGDAGMPPSALWTNRRSAIPTPLAFALANLDLIRLRSSEIEPDEIMANANYFLFHPEELDTPFEAYGDPIGLVVSEGIVLNPPQTNRACLLHRAGGIAIERVQIADVTIELPDGSQIPVHGRGSYRASGGPQALARYYGAPGGVTETQAGVIEIAIVGRHAVAVMRGGGMPVPRTGCVLRFPSPPEPYLLQALCEGAPVVYRLPHDGVDEAVQAGPRILDAGEPRLDDVDFLAEGVFMPEAMGDLRQSSPYRWMADADQTRAARLAVGVRADGSSFLCGIEGQSSYDERSAEARGATLRDLAHLLRTLGARDGLHLDGGGSTQIFRTMGGALLRPGDRHHAFSDQLASYDRPVPLGLRMHLAP